ncbi:hypothetical protein SISNIDRAFT_549140 [Sistotremastrum niveocremeum HHB9708]|uniref:PQ-loop-domain-containing protein n=1 Tax=Sistotremastrum niveocremeum HHB9708 TaxID=1314777 RepID=A0A164VYR8_9AGAM|nr:hypothetical protein SISNIDRAFT_549140 [Sistotremastrum niveocremeum HHB9708]
MKEQKTAENVLGTIGTILWCGQLIPQAWKTWREHSAEGLSASFMLLWALAAIFLGVYNIVQDINIPLIVQPQAFGFLAVICWTQCLYYQSKKPFILCLIILVVFSLGATGFEVGMTFALRHALKVHPESGNRGVQFFGIMSSVLVSLGLVPQYIEIWKLKQVKGVSYAFMTIDISGAVFSVLSLAFKAKWDVLASVVYSLVILLDGLVLIAACILNPRARRIQRQEKARLDAEKAEAASHPSPSSGSLNPA